MAKFNERTINLILAKARRNVAVVAEHIDTAERVGIDWVKGNLLRDVNSVLVCKNQTSELSFRLEQVIAECVLAIYLNEKEGKDGTTRNNKSSSTL